MPFYDIFNGDADGICALHQLRLVEPRAARLVTGVKRDIGLLARVPAAAADELTVLDVSFDVNRAAAQAALAAGARIRWFDHHYAGELPAHPGLVAIIDTSPDVCTSLLVDRALGGRHRAWAVVAAFGDNLHAVARKAAEPLALAAHALAQLAALGECINYNAYGETPDDLYYPPADLYRALAPYPDPFRFLSGEPIYDVLSAGMADDLYRAGEATRLADGPGAVAVLLPDAAWARRVSGVYGNRLARDEPDRAHAVLTACAGGYRVSVRSPVDRPGGAETLCRGFGGGGRAGAAGIDRLAETDLDRFLAALLARWPDTERASAP